VSFEDTKVGNVLAGLSLVVEGMSKRLFVGVLSVVLVVGATVGIAVSADRDDPRSPTRAKDFDPDSITGKWTGEWHNTTFDSRGSIRANVKFKNDKLTPMVDFGGFVFGCDDPPEAKVTLKEGKGANTYNDKGFKVSTDTEAFGQLDITYKHSDGSFTGTGKQPPCAPEITFEIDGKLTKKSFTAEVTNHLGGGLDAKSDLTADKG
jgi:hypothetical protein